MSQPAPDLTMQPKLPGPGEPRCGKMVGEAGGVSYSCQLSPQHTSPCYATESIRSKHAWTSWAETEIAKQRRTDHVHSFRAAGAHLIVCACGEQQRTVEAVLPNQDDDVAAQFSAATGVQAALREEQQHPHSEPDPPLVQPEAAPAPVPDKQERDEALDVAAAMVENTDPSPGYEIPSGVEDIVAEMRKHHRYADNGDLPLSKRFLALTAVGILFEHLDDAMVEAGHAGWPAP